MKNRSNNALISLGFLMLLIFFSAVSLAKDPGYTVAGTIKVQQTGDIMLGMKSEQEEKSGQPVQLGLQIKVGQAEVERGEVAFAMHDIPEGVYAIQCFQDTNGNGKMDFFLGIPLEPWGSYRDVRPKFRGPKFNEISFKVDRDITDITFRLKK